MCDGLPRIRQHFTPVVPAQPLGLVAYLTHADDLIVTYTVKMVHNSFFLKILVLDSNSFSIKMTTELGEVVF